MENIYNWGIQYAINKIYPLTLQHLIYVIITSAIVYYITEYFLRYNLIRWIYFGTLTVIAVELFNGGHTEDGAKELFKLAIS
jgi:hypothetical protein